MATSSDRSARSNGGTFADPAIAPRYGHLDLGASLSGEAQTRCPAAACASEEQPFLSPVSIWEARHLVRRKRLRIKTGFSDWLEIVFARVPLTEAPFNFAMAVEASSIELPESDPGDVFLAATASVFRLTLVTADSQFAGRSWLKTLAND